MKQGTDLRVVAAAIKDANGKIHSIPAPARHFHIIRLMASLDINTMGPDVTQGFLLSDGRFCRRKPAKIIARNANQLLPRASESGDLFSEDVW